MDFSAISSVKSYVKNLEMQQKWQKKKDENDFTPQSQIDRWIEEQRKQAEGIPGSAIKNQEKYMQSIRNKIAGGQTLTIEEEIYLRDHDPVTYQQLKAAENEEKSYERELKHCKTKEEVDRVKMAHVSSSLAAVNDVKNNPDIPKAKKLAILSVEQRKMDAIAKITAKFVKSGAYADLPTEEEKREAEELLREAEKEQTVPDTEKKADKSSESDDVETVKTEINEYAVTDEVKVSAEKPDNDIDMTVEEAQNTPEMLKVKRARARAAYEKTRDMDHEDKSGGAKMNLSI